jgi:uncharacterized protein YukE
MMSRTNIARDQASLIQLLDNEIDALQARWNVNSEVVLDWETSRFSDALESYQETLSECLDSVVERYDIAATYIKNALYVCAVPTK